MRRLIRQTALVVSCLAVTACATTMSVSSHVDRGADFTRYRTYDWGPADALPTGDARLDANPFFKDHLQGEVDKQLAARGINVAASGPADLLIHYHANIRQRLDVRGVDTSRGYTSEGPLHEYEAGTIVVDLVDARHPEGDLARVGTGRRDGDARQPGHDGDEGTGGRHADVRRIPTRTAAAALMRGVPGARQTTALADTPPSLEHAMSVQSRWARVAALIVVAAACGACAVPVRVNAYAERGADLSRYRTYDFATLASGATGDPRLDSNPFFNERVRAAVEKQLRAKGYERATSGAPDLRVHFHASVKQDIMVNEVDQRSGYCGDGECTPFVYDAGTLLMDLVDAGTNKLVWRGWAESSMDGVVDNQRWMERKVDDAVARIVAKLPRRS